MKERRNYTGVALASILTLLTLPPFLAREPDNRPDPPDVSPRVRTPLIRVEEVSSPAANPAAMALPLPPAVGDAWIHLGPGPLLNGQVENISPDDEVVGAIHTVAAHPTDPDILLLGAVNGGIWRTTNASDPSPDWTPLIDFSPTLSIGALEFDPTDSTHQTLVGGVGLFSSFGRVGGARTGLLRTTNGGDNWTQITGGGILNGKNISGVAARGNTIVISVNIADSFTFRNVGIFRSTNGGATFTQISVGDGTATGLPGGVANDLAGDPASSGTLYTSITFAPIVGGLNGIYRSTDTGATWTKVSNAAMDLLILDGTTNNLEMSAGASGQVFAGIINIGQLAGLFRSGNGGATWVEMDLPVTNEDGIDIGLQPTAKASSQGSIHFSILADPNNTNIVYLGGDRQPMAFGDTGGFPNSIGANDFSGRLFRCDASQAAGSQCVHLTHSNTLGAAGGGTAGSSSPHADSREMVFSAAGNLIEVDDGGIYQRTSPQDNTGDWFSIIGNLGVTEIHDIAYDPVSNIVFGGDQDTGTPEMILPGGKIWNSLATADGGDVAVDSTSMPGFSIRYSSFQFLSGFRRLVYDPDNNFISISFPTLTVLGGGAAVVGQFVTPVELNAIDPTRMIIVGDNSIYESLDEGNTLTEIGPGQGPNDSPFSSFQIAVAYGGRSGGVANEEILYVGVTNTNPIPALIEILIRTTAGGGLVASATYPGGTVRDVVMDPDDFQTAYVIDPTSVYRTTDTGATWTDITGNLTDGDLNTIVFAAGSNLTVPAGDSIFVGGRNGVFQMGTGNPGVWVEFGIGLPQALAYDLDYDPSDDVLVVGTLGRGAWFLGAPTLSAGQIPNGDDVAGTPLNVTEAVGGDITLTWAASCSATDTDFAIYEGTMGNFNSHLPVFCSTGGATALTFTPAAESTYYLVVPKNLDREGSYGTGKLGAERPRSDLACLLQATGTCP